MACGLIHFSKRCVSTRELSSCKKLFSTVLYCTLLYGTVQYSILHSLKALIITSKSPITNWKKGEDCFKCAKGQEVYLQSLDYDFKLNGCKWCKVCYSVAKGAKVLGFKGISVLIGAKGNKGA